MALTQDATIADLQRANAALQQQLDEQCAERDAALAREAALAEVLQVINCSPGNPAPVFEAILQRAHSICGAAAGALMTYDGAMLHAVATHGYPEQYVAMMRRPFPPGPRHQALMRGERLVHIPDVRAFDLGPSADAVARSFADLTGVRTYLVMPLRKDGVVLGFISAHRREIRPFSDAEIALLESFAAQAVIALENTRLLGELRQRTGDLQESLEYQTATGDVLKVISRSAFDLNTVLQTVVTSAVNLCRADRATLYRYRDGHCHFEVGHNNLPEYERLERDSPIAASRETLVGRTMLERTAVQIVDPMYDPEYAPKGELVIGDINSMLGVPLLRDGCLIGVFGMARTEVEQFTHREIKLVTTFADQAVIAMENARLINEQREALEQQTATAEVLQVINASPGNLAPMFDAMLDKAMRLCEASGGALRTYDGDHFHAAAIRGMPAAFVEQTREVWPEPGTALGRIEHGERLIHIADLTDISDPRIGTPPRRQMLEVGAIRTALWVALRNDQQLLGTFVLYRTEVRPFSDKHIALVGNFAAQAVIAMESARLLHELRARTDELAQRQAELRVTFENMGDGVALFDATRRLVAWNTKFQEIFDVPDALLEQHKTYADYIRLLTERGDYGPGADPEEQIRRLSEGADQYHAYERTRPDGRVIEVRHNPVPAGGFVLIYTDITERKRNEAELRAAFDATEAANRTIEAAYRDLKTAQANLIQAEKMASLGQLTAGIAHEIKNPLNFVNNFAILSVELLHELKDTAAPAFAMLDDATRADIADVTGMLTGNLEKITEHGRRADGIVRSMLEHSRGESGERREADLNTLVEEALNLAYHGARAQDQSFNITLERDYAADIAPVELTPQDVTRVFLNLFSNGFYAATRRARGDPAPGFEPTIRVATRDLGDAVEIRVRDNGIGIPPDIKDKLFQPFFTTKPTGEGTGLGLSISYDVVTQQHGGSITVDSRVGEYSEFTIRLPRAR